MEIWPSWGEMGWIKCLFKLIISPKKNHALKVNFLLYVFKICSGLFCAQYENEQANLVELTIKVDTYYITGKISPFVKGWSGHMSSVDDLNRKYPCNWIRRIMNYIRKYFLKHSGCVWVFPPWPADMCDHLKCSSFFLKLIMTDNLKQGCKQRIYVWLYLMQIIWWLKIKLV